MIYSSHPPLPASPICVCVCIDSPYHPLMLYLYVCPWKNNVLFLMFVLLDDVSWVFHIIETRRFVGNSFSTSLSTTSQKE